jgi:PIN domain nuclease of toxin-antitoxin system
VIVLDASAALAYVFAEPGAETVDAVTDGAFMSAVNWAETLSRMAREAMALDWPESSRFTIVEFDAAQARTAAESLPATRPLGLSLADRACLGLALSRKLPVLTADPAWRGLDLGVEVRLIRP